MREFSRKSRINVLISVICQASDNPSSSYFKVILLSLGIDIVKASFQYFYGAGREVDFD